MKLEKRVQNAEQFGLVTDPAFKDSNGFTRFRPLADNPHRAESIA